MALSTARLANLAGSDRIVSTVPDSLPNSRAIRKKVAKIVPKFAMANQIRVFYQLLVMLYARIAEGVTLEKIVRFARRGFSRKTGSVKNVIATRRVPPQNRAPGPVEDKSTTIFLKLF